MITVSADQQTAPHANSPPPSACIIARPNQSASWQSNKRLIVIIGIFSGLVATLFSAIGAWLILPVAGLEITALGSALYLVCRRAGLRHILHVQGQQLLLEKGHRHSLQRWQLDKTNTSLFVERQQHPWDPVKISLYYRHQHHPKKKRDNNCQQGQIELIPIGEFLNKDDSQRLLAALRQQGLKVRNDSCNGDISL
jgi:uncharacterized membrane protein